MRKTLGLITALMLTPAYASAQEGTRVQITGEIIDTWCYFSGVMGGPDAVVGSSHHTCALWCSAGGIPVGILGEDGTVYTVLKVGEDDESAGGDTLLTLASYSVTADGMLYPRDGINYLVVANVVAEDAISNLTHEDYGPVPGFAIPEPKP
ncbi:hypothetical protein [Sulfitobacter guttiformis]|uniref:Uncharacterized protein n=1 Tax=Sulfitobacter guttiformis TaxID=74349 RepID=A0A420DQ58_9RHOB|nr:hypothetical protein [Sulfitobacter guttiformis]KIN73655.1 Glutamate synthase domain 2 [Sulfitobacter guttiformis KCTC 32187]RKE96299.1 hypothetical protein C8N30_0856 [Sulfitobacter guttiformis]